MAFFIPTDMIQVCFAVSFEGYQHYISDMTSSISSLSAEQFMILNFVGVFT
jgi:hypothetical protein